MSLNKTKFVNSPFNGGTFNGVDFTIGTEATNAITVNVQLKDGPDAIAERAACRFYLSDDANGDSLAGTAPSGGIAGGTDGVVLVEEVANKVLTVVSEADGDIDLVITETGADTWYLIAILPDGRLVASSAITFA